MMKCMVEAWDKNKNILKKNLEEWYIKAKDEWIGVENYKDIVSILFESIWNCDEHPYGEQIDIKKITEIDNGDYQGTLIYVIPFDTYQPTEYQYIMTYVGYGSCSGCDTLQAIMSEFQTKEEERIPALMQLCKDILCNTIRPYNNGWRHDENWDSE